MGKSFQNVKFSSIEDFLDSLPEDELKIVELLRKEVYACIPNVNEKLSFNVPFFKRHKTICLFGLAVFGGAASKPSVACSLDLRRGID